MRNGQEDLVVSIVVGYGFVISEIIKDGDQGRMKNGGTWRAAQLKHRLVCCNLCQFFESTRKERNGDWCRRLIASR